MGTELLCQFGRILHRQYDAGVATDTCDLRGILANDRRSQHQPRATGPDGKFGLPGCGVPVVFINYKL